MSPSTRGLGGIFRVSRGLAGTDFVIDAIESLLEPLDTFDIFLVLISSFFPVNFPSCSDLSKLI